MPKIVMEETAREVWSLGMEENVNMEFSVDEENFFGNKMGNRNVNLRILYNNVNGLKINDFLKSKVAESYEKRTKKILKNVKKVEKITGVMATLRKLDVNIICLAESQVAWEIFHVREKIQEELRRVDV